MIKNYFKLAIRQFKFQPLFVLINILGLSIGIVCSIFIFLWVNHEISYDKFHPNVENIYRIESLMDFETPTLWTSSPEPLAEALKNDIPEILESTKLHKSWRNISVSFEDKAFEEFSFYFVSPSYFDIFYFPKTKYDPKVFLKDPFTLLISESISEKYFGNDDPIGKTLKVNNKYIYTVKGVYKDLPKNSHLTIDFITSFNTLKFTGTKSGIWGQFDYKTYIKIDPNCDIQNLKDKLSGFLTKYNEGTSTKLQLQSVKKIHLFAESGNGDITYVYIFSAIGVLILFIAFINFVNISTARAIERNKEIAIRKTVGASRKNLIIQIFSELMLLTIISLILAFVSSFLMLPAFNILTAKQLSLISFIFSPVFIYFLGIIIVSVLLAGLYPALYLSSFHPISIFSKKLSGLKGNTIRKLLVIFQFTISALLIFSTFVIKDQLHFIQNANLGFNKEHVMYIRLDTDGLKKQEIIKTELEKNTNINELSVSNRIPVSMGTFNHINEWEGKTSDDNIMVNEMRVDHKFIQLFDIEIIDGRDFRVDEGGNKVLINKEAKKRMNLQNPAGKTVNRGSKTFEIVGVVNDFYFKTLKKEISPLFLYYTTEGTYLNIKINTDNILNTVQSIENSVKEIVPESPFAFGFIDEEIDNLYRTEIRISKIVDLFTLLAVIASCLGLFGLAAYMAQSRTKEIGIRKTHGASLKQILILMLKEIFALVLISNLIACIAGKYIMERWLEGFAYKIEIGAGIYIGVVSISVLLSLITVSFHTIKSANSNPIDALRHE